MLSFIRSKVWTLRKLLRRNLPQAVVLPDNIILTRTVFSHKMLVDSLDISISPHILLDGYWEEDTTTVVRRHLHRGMTYLEIGTNVGYYSVLAASLVGTTGRVLGFEANPRMAHLANRSLYLNGFADYAHVTHAAVSDREGTVTLHTSRDLLGGSSIIPGVVEKNAILATSSSEMRQEITVPCTTIDCATVDLGRDIDFIKIDIEGAEPLAIRGMTRLLGQKKPLKIILEFFPDMIRTAGADPMALLESLRGYGFAISVIQPDGSCKPANTDKLLSLRYHVDLFLERF